MPVFADLRQKSFTYRVTNRATEHLLMIAPVRSAPRTAVRVGLLRYYAVPAAGVVPTTVNCLQYLATGSKLTAVEPLQLPVPQSGTLSRISSGTRPSVQTLSDVCLKRTCSLDTSAFSALEVVDDNRALYKFTYLLTYLLR